MTIKVKIFFDRTQASPGSLLVRGIDEKGRIFITQRRSERPTSWKEDFQQRRNKISSSDLDNVLEPILFSRA